MNHKRQRRAASRPARKGASLAREDGWIPDLSRTGRSKYDVLVESLRDAISRGELLDGERLPSQRALAARLGVNIATVTKAIAEAGRLGLVSTRPGGGTVVTGGRPAATASGPASGAVDLSVNIPPSSLVKAMLDAALLGLARQRRGDSLFGYAPLGGTPRDREAGRSWIERRGLEASADRVLVTNGAYEGIFAALAAVTRPGDVVACEGLNYTGVRRVAELCRLKLVGVATDEGGLRPDALDEACAKHAPKAILTTPVTLNPTTATQDLRRRNAILAVARRRGVTLVEDDIYGHLAGEVPPPLAALWPEGVLYVTSLSKCVAPGLRVGYLVAPQRYAGRAREALQLMSWTAPALHVGVAAELLEAGLAQSCADAHRAEALRRMALARNILGRNFVAGTVATYHGWLRLPTPWDERSATTAFQRHGVLVSPAQHFVVGGTAPPAAVRLSLGAAADTATLERALRSLAGVLAMRSAGTASIV